MHSAGDIEDRVASLRPRFFQRDISGISTAWWEYGSPATTDVVVMAHGFRGDHHGLEGLAAYWPEARIVIPDLPGFNQTAAPVGGAHLNNYAHWLTQFVDTVRPRTGRTLLVGHSFGTIVSAAAVAGGLEVNQLALINPVGRPYQNGKLGPLVRAGAVVHRFAARLPDRLGRILVASRFSTRMMSVANVTTRNPSLRRWIHREHDRYFSTFTSLGTLWESYEASIRHSVAEFAARIKTPTLLIATARDPVTPVNEQERLVTLFPNAQLVILPRIAHLTHYEAPAVAVELIRNFWQPRP